MAFSVAGLANPECQPVKLDNELFAITPSSLKRPPPLDFNTKVKLAIFFAFFWPLILSILALITFLSWFFGKPFTNKVAGFMIPKIMGKIDKMFEPARRELLKKVSGKVLDFGAGNAIYMKYCFVHPYTNLPNADVKRYVALEPNLQLHPKIRKMHDKVLEDLMKEIKKRCAGNSSASSAGNSSAYGTPLESEGDFHSVGDISNASEHNPLISPSGKVFSNIENNSPEKVGVRPAFLEQQDSMNEIEGVGYGRQALQRADSLNMMQDLMRTIPQMDISAKYLDEYSKDIPKGFFDWIILGNVLCEVPDPPAILKQLDSLLKPGGRVYFQEHVSYPEGTFLNKMQHFVNPWWSMISDGCNCNRDSINVIRKTCPNWDVQEWAFDRTGVMPWNWLMKIGICVKRS